MAENIDVNVNVNTNTANRNLDNLNKQVTGLSNAFGKLRNVLAGVAFGSIINNALNLAASLVDVSKSTDIALESVLGFSRAVQANGGSLADAQSALQKFNITIGEAAQGSATLQTAFQNVGVSLNDLRNLSQTDLLQKTIQGLAKIKDASERARVANDLLGKSFKGIDILGLANDYAKTVEESRKYAGAIKTADQVQQNLETSITNLQIALLAVLKPIGDLAKSITTNIDSLVKWMKTIYAFLEILAGFFIIGKIVTWLKMAYLGFVAFGKSIGDAYRAWKVLSNGFGATLGGIITNFSKLKEMIASTGVVGQTIGTALSRVFKGLAKGAEIIAGLILTITGLKAAWEKFNEVTQQQNLDEIVDYIDQLNESSTEAWMVAQENARAQREVTDALAKQAEAIRQTSVAYKEQNNEVLRGLDLQKEQLSTSADEFELQTALIDNSERLRKALEDLQKQRNEAAADPEKSSLVSVYDEEMNKIRENAAASHDAIIQKITDIQELKNAQDILLKQQELLKQGLTDDAAIKALQDQLALIQLYGDELENANIALEVTQSLEQSLLEFRKQELDLIARKGQLTDEQFQRELAQIEALRQAAYKRAGDEIDARTQIKEAQRVADEDANLGIQKYIDELEKSVSPAKRALESVQSVFGNMENALNTFVTTGKFKFKDFALSVIQDLLLIQAKAALVSVFKGVLKGLGIFGFAEGGSPPVGKVSLVGEKGPELFVPRQAGTIIPNDQLTSKAKGTGMVNAPVTNNYITNNINALDAKSVAQLFAENRKTLLGVTETARREMAYGM
jgi:lambda family phage tail tape measure protein